MDRTKTGRLFFLVVMLGTGFPCSAELPYAAGQRPANPYDYAAWLFIDGENDLPATFHLEDTWWLTDFRGSDLQIVYNPQELFGVRGMGVNRAWEISTGRPDVTIAILDSGIRWNQPRYCTLLRKYFLNRAELPLPRGGPNENDTRFGGYDVNNDGVFNVEDYWGDPNITDVNGNGWIDPEDLILQFSDGIDADNNGYVDDISGWDFFENDNNPQDDTDYGHGTNQARHGAAEAVGNGETCAANPEAAFSHTPGTCPNCMVIPLRVGDSFIADVNHYAQAVVYAVDNGAEAVECALGSLNHTSFGQAATDYAFENGVIVNASAADEASAHDNWPAAYEHTMVHNSLKPPEALGTTPHGYLYLNGCTNFGAYIHTAIPSSGCSSQATGLAAGLSGLLISAALNAVERGDLTSYIRDDGSRADFTLSPGEMKQLWRLAADDIDFATDHPEHAFSGLWEEYRPWWWLGPPTSESDNFDVLTSLIATKRYQTGPGWDYFTGYGRINAARLLRYIGLENGQESREYPSNGGPYAVGHDQELTAQDRVPPEADILTPRLRHQYAYDVDHRLMIPDDPESPAVVVVTGRTAANRVTAAGGNYDYVLEWAPGAQGRAGQSPAPDSEERSPGPWRVANRVNGLQAAFQGELGRIPVAELAGAVAEHPYPFNPDPIGPSQSEAHALRLRLRVIAHPADNHDRVNNEAIHQKQVDIYPAAELVLRNDLGTDGSVTGGCGSPSFFDLDGDGRDELLVPTDDGLIHAFTDVAQGTELEGWPVHTLPLPGQPETGDNAMTRGHIQAGYSSVLFGAVAVADLDDNGHASLLATDYDGRLYVWERDGSPRSGFPVSVDPTLSHEIPCGPDTIPNCDDYSGAEIRDPWNTRDQAFFSAPAVGDLDPGYPGLEILAAAADAHVYAWHADGTPVDGWPVLLRDPGKVAAMDPFTRKITFRKDSRVLPGTRAITTPALGDLDGDGFLEVIVNVNEEYAESPNATLGDTLIELLLEELEGFANTRIYALAHTGTRTQGTAATERTAHLHDQAYLPGWPVPIAIMGPDLLPIVGQGSDTQPVLADIDHDGTLEIITASHFGPAYILDHDGSSFLGASDGVYRTLDRKDRHFGSESAAGDGPSYTAFGGMAIGSLHGDNQLTIASGAAGIQRALDIVLVGRQTGAEDHLSLWHAHTGQYEPNAPLEVNDLQFLATPIFADVNGDGRAEVIQQTSFNDLVSAGSDDTDKTATVRHTGGWQINSAAMGKAPLGEKDQPILNLVSFSREGYLRIYATTTPESGEPARLALGEWPQAGHDPRNTGNYETDATPPPPVTDLIAFPLRGTVFLTFNGSGQSHDYRVRFYRGEGAPQWNSATPVATSRVFPVRGQRQAFRIIEAPAPGQYTFLIRAYDAAGNGSAPASIRVTIN